MPAAGRELAQAPGMGVKAGVKDVKAGVNDACGSPRWPMSPAIFRAGSPTRAADAGAEAGGYLWRLHMWREHAI
jgi:hypothetical protein